MISGLEVGHKEKEKGTEKITLVSASLQADRKLERELNPKDQVFNCWGLSHRRHRAIFQAPSGACEVWAALSELLSFLEQRVGSSSGPWLRDKEIIRGTEAQGNVFLSPCNFNTKTNQVLRDQETL